MSKRGTTPFMSAIAHHAADPFRLLIESVVDYAIFILDPAGNVASWNPGAERIYGYRAEQIVGRHFSCFYCPEDAASGAPGRELQCALQDGHDERECMRVRQDGSRFHAISTISDLKDFFGQHAGFAKVTRDITDRKHAEEVVRRERDLSAAILGSLPGVYYMYDEQGRFLRWNRRFEVVTEYSASEIANLHPLDLFEGEDKQLLAERIADVFRNGWGEVEANFVAKSGRRTPYYFNGVRAEIEGKHCLLGMGIDISRQKQAVEALGATDVRLRLAVTAANVGLWDWDLRTNEVYYSPEWKRQLGYEEHEIGTAFDEWQRRVHVDDLQPALERLHAFVADPARKYAAEFRIRHRDGSYRWILSQASILFDDKQKPRACSDHTSTSPSKGSWRRNSSSRKRWKQSDGWPVGWRTTSTTCSSSSTGTRICCLPNCPPTARRASCSWKSRRPGGVEER
jgi:PAS domain S-box-containing protein